MRERLYRGLAILVLSFIALGSLYAGSPAGSRFSITPSSVASNFFAVAGGGGISSGGTFTVHGTIGQAVAGVATGGDYRLVTGFWIDNNQWSVYVPVVTR